MIRLVPWALGLLALFVLGFLLLGVFSFDSTDKSEIGVHYSGGPIEGQHFEKVVPPGTPLRPYGPFDTLIKLPANQRTFIISEQGDGDVRGEITAANKSGVDVGYETSLWFALNTDEEAIQEFVEQVCSKYDDCQGDGWDQMLEANLARAQETALLNASKDYTTDEMRLGDGITQIQTDVNERMPDAVRENLGGPYFEVRGFQISDPDYPQDVVEGYEARERARLLLETRKNETDAAEEQAKAAQELAQLDDDYIALQQAEAFQTAVEKGNVEFWVLPQGMSVQAPAR